MYQFDLESLGRVDAYFKPLVDEQESLGVIMLARGNDLLIERALCHGRF